MIGVPLIEDVAERKRLVHNAGAVGFKVDSLIVDGYRNALGLSGHKADFGRAGVRLLGGAGNRCRFLSLIVNVYLYVRLAPLCNRVLQRELSWGGFIRSGS